MSWSLYVTAKTPAAAQRYVAEQKEKSPETPHAMPREAKNLVLDAIALAGVTAEGVGLKIEASGHSPNGSCRVTVEPITIID